MKNFYLLYLFILALLFVSETRADEIQGTVRETSGDVATIATDSGRLPNVGDKVMIYFNIPGTQDEISVGTGRISVTGSDSIKAKIENTTGKVAKGQRVRITSDQAKNQTDDQKLDTSFGEAIEHQEPPSSGHKPQPVVTGSLVDCEVEFKTHGTKATPFTCNCPALPEDGSEPISINSDGSVAMICHLARISNAVGPKGGMVKVYPQSTEDSIESGDTAAIVTKQSDNEMPSFRIEHAD